MTSSSANPQPQKYFFDSEFDYSETVDDIQSITPKTHAADIEAAKTEAYQQGHADGVKETNDGIARMAGDQLFVITSKLEELIETEAEIMKHFHQDIAQVTDLIIQKMLPVIADQGARQEVQGMLERIQGRLPKDQTITISVHPQLRADIDAHIAALKNNAHFQAQILVTEDPTLTITDCAAAWEGAGITQYKAATMAEIQESLLRLAKTPLTFEPQPQDPVAGSDTHSEDETNHDQSDIDQNNDDQADQTQSKNNQEDISQHPEEVVTEASASKETEDND